MVTAPADPTKRERQLRALARRKSLFLVRLTGAARDGDAAYALIPQGGNFTLEQAEAVLGGRSH